MAAVGTTAQKPRIRGLILGPLSLVVAVLVGALTFGVYWVVKAQGEAEVARVVTAAQEMLQIEQEENEKDIEVALDGVLRDHSFAAPLIAADRDALLRLANPVYDRLRRDGISHLYFTDPQRRIILRVHAPAKFGDINNRLSMLEAERNGSVGSGMEVGPFGAMTLREVMPYRVDDKVVGYLEMGKEIGLTFDKIHQVLGIDLVTLIDKRLIKPEFWNEGMANFGWPFALDRLPEVAVTSHSLAQLPDKLVAALASAPANGGLEARYLHVGGRVLYLTPLPLHDAQRQRVGSLIIIADFTDQVARSRTLMLAGAALCVGLGLGLMFLFHRLLGQVERKVTAALERLASSNADLERVAYVAIQQLDAPAGKVVRLAQALIARAPTGLDDDSVEMLDGIAEGGKRIREAIGGIEDYLDLNVNSRAKEPVALDAVLAAALERLQPLWRQAEVTADPLPVVVGHPVLLARAFLCLIENAFAHHGGQGASKLAITVQGDATQWRISFSDNGTGLYSEADSDGAENGPGSGIALAAVRRIAELHGGSVQIYSNPQTGTTVMLTLGQIPVEAEKRVAVEV